MESCRGNGSCFPAAHADRPGQGKLRIRITRFREETMATYSNGFLGRARHSLSCAALALITAALLCTCIVDRAMAATPGPAGVNRTVPKVSPPKELSFSSPPTDAQFLRTGLFAEPLAPVAATTPEENRDLAQSVLAYRDAIRATGANDAVEPLLTFLAAHPASPWKPALQLNLGMQGGPGGAIEGGAVGTIAGVVGGYVSSVAAAKAAAASCPAH